MNLDITIWDVEHGSAAFIKTPNGKTIVKDLGTGSFKASSDTFSPLLHIKRKHAIDRLDSVIISHPHKDHIDDILNLEKLHPRILSRPRGLSRDEVMKSVRREDKPLFDKYFEFDEGYSAPVADEENPFLEANNGGVSIKNFFPTECSSSNLNNRSIVTVISYAISKVVIPGDNEPESWRELLGDDAFKKAIKGPYVVLVAPHHGRESGYCEDLFEDSTPILTVISDDQVTESCARDKYTKLSKGWKVHHRGETESEVRKCVTTRSDGDIEIQIGYNDAEKSSPFLCVTVD